MKLILIIFSLTTFHFSLTIRNPIILIPGIGGNQIEMRMDKNAEIRKLCKKTTNYFSTIWVNMEYCLTRTPSCMFDALRLTYDAETHKTNNYPGIHTHIPGFGYTNTTEYLATTKFVSPYLRKFVKRMVRLGYTPGLSIRAAPYDFRKGPNELEEYFDQLKTLIEDTSRKNENKKIVLIAHSLGGLISLIFLQKRSPRWKNQYVQFVISLASPWAGAVKAIEAYIRGLEAKEIKRELDESGEMARRQRFFDNEEVIAVVDGYFEDLDESSYYVTGFGLRGTEFTKSSFKTSTTPSLRPYKYIIIPQITLIPKRTVQTLPAVIWLFPSSEAWKKDDVLVRIKDRTYTLESMKEFFEDIQQPNGWKMYNDRKEFATELIPSGVDLYCFYGTGFRTIASVYSEHSFWDTFRYVQHEDGDGIVNKRSLEVCTKWKDGTTTVETRAFPGVNHMSILTSSRVFKNIIDLIGID